MYFLVSALRRSMKLMSWAIRAHPCACVDEKRVGARAGPAREVVTRPAPRPRAGGAAMSAAASRAVANFPVASQ